MEPVSNWGLCNAGRMLNRVVENRIFSEASPQAHSSCNAVWGSRSRYVGPRTWSKFRRSVERPAGLHRKRAHGEGPGRGHKRVDNINSFTEGGTDPTYILRRLKRDRPELAEKVISGEMKAHAAAIEAGFRKRTVSIPLEPRQSHETSRRRSRRTPEG
jgi:hypothetical protein